MVTGEKFPISPAAVPARRYCFGYLLADASPLHRFTLIACRANLSVITSAIRSHDTRRPRAPEKPHSPGDGRISRSSLDASFAVALAISMPSLAGMASPSICQLDPPACLDSGTLWPAEAEAGDERFRDWREGAMPRYSANIYAAGRCFIRR